MMGPGILRKCGIVLSIIFVLTLPAHAQKPVLDENVSEEIYELLTDFVTNTYLSGAIHKRRLYNVHYARRLKKYWKKKNVRRRFVIADKRRYLRRWPRYRYRMNPKTLQIFQIVGEQGSYALRFEYDYDLGAPGRYQTGVGRTEMLLRVIDGTPVIYREAGRVLKKY